MGNIRNACGVCAVREVPRRRLRMVRDVMSTATLTRPSVYALMPDQVLDSAIAELERVTTQEAFAYAPARERSAYLGALDAARAEAERRAA